MAFDKERQETRGGRPQRRGRKKVCSFCVDRIDHIDYKDVPVCASICPSARRSFPAASRAPVRSISVS